MARVHEPSNSPSTFRIGEVAKLTGLTTRTLRYWEELGLIRPGAYRGSGERRYTQTDMARVTRIRELQELLGFSLAEVRVVLDTEDIDVLDRVRSEYRRGGMGSARRLVLLEEAIEANDKLLARLDSTLARIGAFRDERAEKAVSLRASRDTLMAEIDAGTASPPTDAAPPSTRRRRRAAATSSTRTTGRAKKPTVVDGPPSRRPMEGASPR
jgi:DNA-binding transcriptional MerR regulator